MHTYPYTFRCAPNPRSGLQKTSALSSAQCFASSRISSQPGNLQPSTALIYLSICLSINLPAYLKAYFANAKGNVMLYYVVLSYPIPIQVLHSSKASADGNANAHANTNADTMTCHVMLCSGVASCNAYAMFWQIMVFMFAHLRQNITLTLHYEQHRIAQHSIAWPGLVQRSAAEQSIAQHSIA